MSDIERHFMKYLSLGRCITIPIIKNLDEKEKTMNRIESIEALARGEKVTHCDWCSDEFMYMENGTLKNEVSAATNSHFDQTCGYVIYKEKAVMVKWHRVTYFRKNAEQPQLSDYLHESEQEFRDNNEHLSFEWVHLAFVCEKEEV